MISEKLSVKERTPTVVQCYDVEAVEQLPFVLVNPLHVDIEHGVGVDLHLVVLLKVGGKLHLVLLKVEIKQSNSNHRSTERELPPRGRPLTATRQVAVCIHVCNILCIVKAFVKEFVL